MDDCDLRSWSFLSCANLTIRLHLRSWRLSLDRLLNRHCDSHCFYHLVIPSIFFIRPIAGPITVIAIILILLPALKLLRRNGRVS